MPGMSDSEEVEAADDVDVTDSVELGRYGAAVLEAAP